MQNVIKCYIHDNSVNDSYMYIPVMEINFSEFALPATMFI